MKKNSFLIAAIVAFVSAIPSVVKGQVGIQTQTPAATLDVVAKNPTGATTNVDGLLIPRVDRQRAQSMTGIATSTLIYVNSIATGTQAGTAANIDAVGYYYFNGTIWTKFNSSSSPSINIYNADGALTGNRIVTQGANTLAFNGTAVNAFSVDGTTLSVDAANNRVGIGNGTPGVNLEIGNGVANSANPFLRLHSSGNAYGSGGVLEFTEASESYGIRIRHQTGSDATHVEGLHFNILSAGTESNTILALDQINNRVGIGTAAPVQPLHVQGIARITGSATTAATNIMGRDANGDISNLTLGTGLSITGGALNVAAGSSTNIYNTDGTLTGNRTVTQGANTLAFNGTAVNAFSVDGTTLSVDATNNRVGVGTSAPGQTLSVSDPNTGTVATTSILQPNLGVNNSTYLKLGRAIANNDAADILFTNAGTGSTNNSLSLGFSGNSATVATFRADGNMGVGTAAPAQRLHVAGAARITGSAGTATGVMGRDANGDISNLTLGTGLSITGGALNVAAGSSTNIYNTDGTLTGNRTVTQGANTLAFNGTAVNAFSVDGTTLSVDATNNRLGVGTAAPGQTLSVSDPNTGDIATTSILQPNLGVNNSTYMKLGRALATNDAADILFTNAGTGSTNNSLSLGFSGNSATVATFRADGNMGVGTATPAQRLHVAGAARITGSAGTATGVMGRDANGDISNLTLGTGLSITGGALNVAAGSSTNIYNTDGTLTGNRTVTQGANTLAFNGTAVNAFSVDGTTLSVDATNNRVGIGSATPGEQLTVVDGSNANQYNGIASFLANNLTSGVGIGWLGIRAIGSNTNNALALNGKGTGDILMQADGQATGNVGIGTGTPAQKLHVTGAARITGSAGTATDIVGRDANGDVSNLTLGTGLSITAGTLAPSPEVMRINILATTASNNGVTNLSFATAGLNTIANSTVAAGGITLPVGVYRISTNINTNFSTASTTQYMEVYIPGQGDIRHGIFSKPVATSTQGFISGSTLYNITSGTATINVAVFTANVAAGSTWSAATGPASYIQIERIH